MLCNAQENHQSRCHYVIDVMPLTERHLLQEKAVFKGKFVMQAHGWQGPAYMLCSAQDTAERGRPLSIKLFARGVDYLQEKALLEGPSPSLQEYLPGLVSALSQYLLRHSVEDFLPVRFLPPALSSNALRFSKDALRVVVLLWCGIARVSCRFASTDSSHFASCHSDEY